MGRDAEKEKEGSGGRPSARGRANGVNVWTEHLGHDD